MRIGFVEDNWERRWDIIERTSLFMPIDPKESARYPRRLYCLDESDKEIVESALLAGLSAANAIGCEVTKEKIRLALLLLPTAKSETPTATKPTSTSLEGAE